MLPNECLDKIFYNGSGLTEPYQLHRLQYPGPEMFWISLNSQSLEDYVYIICLMIFKYSADGIGSHKLYSLPGYDGEEFQVSHIFASYICPIKLVNTC